MYILYNFEHLQYTKAFALGKILSPRNSFHLFYVIKRVKRYQHKYLHIIGTVGRNSGFQIDLFSDQLTLKFWKTGWLFYQDEWNRIFYAYFLSCLPLPGIPSVYHKPSHRKALFKSTYIFFPNTLPCTLGFLYRLFFWKIVHISASWLILPMGLSAALIFRERYWENVRKQRFSTCEA